MAGASGVEPQRRARHTGDDTDHAHHLAQRTRHTLALSRDGPHHEQQVGHREQPEPDTDERERAGDDEQRRVGVGEGDGEQTSRLEGEADACSALPVLTVRSMRPAIGAAIAVANGAMPSISPPAIVDSPRTVTR